MIKALTRFFRWLVMALIIISPVGAVQIGDSREAVIAELGEPQSQMSAGKREFLNYGPGRVEITSGVVSGMQGTLTTTAPGEVRAVRKSPATAPSSTAPVRVRSAHWWTDLEQAKARAKRDNKRILALFTGSDWCPPCRQFEATVAHDEQFAGIFANSFVFFKSDWLRNTPQPREVQAEVSRVGHKYGISRYPTLKVLNADGEVLGDVKWTEIGGGGSLKEVMIEAIDDTRKATKDGKAVEKSWWQFW